MFLVKSMVLILRKKLWNRIKLHSLLIRSAIEGGLAITWSELIK